MKLSVVIPCWNDAAALQGLLNSIGNLHGVDEVIVADASETRECCLIAEAAGATVVRCAAPSRGGQMNAGAALATGELLLFHHADSLISQAHVDALRSVADRPEISGGAFHRKFERRTRLIAWLERALRFLNAHGAALYGDQSIFVRRDVFERMGGYQDFPLLEDVEFSRRLRRLMRFGWRIEMLDPPMESSARRFRRHGVLATSLQNGVTLLLFHSGVSPWKLHAWYYRRPPMDRSREKTLPVVRSDVY